MTASTEHGRAAPPAQRLPDFFIVGHSKSGTTALYEMLRAHPQIFMPELKEPVYFARELPRQAHRYRAPETLEEYVALFEPAEPGQLLGEASASYLWSHTAAAEIAKVRPDAKIIAILREPASFLRSLHLQNLQSHYEDEKDLRRALALDGARREGRNLPRRSTWPQVAIYSEHVRYVEQLARYRESFGPEQLLVLIYDDFRADNRGTVRRVLEFLEVDPDVEVMAREANPTVQMRSQQLDEVVHALSVGTGPAARLAKRAVKALTPQGARRGLLKAVRGRLVAGEPEPEDAQLMAELRSRYHDEVLALSEYLGRDLVTLWGYGDAR
ncbi:MAG: sulfotransferase family protein [Solirubrobacteraceae bacterium]